MKVNQFDNLTLAEKGLIAHLRAGKPGFFYASTSVPAKDAASELHIRASLIRALALNKLRDCPLPERGLRVCGAYIFGDGQPGAETCGLDLEGAELPGDLALVHCQIPDQILLRGTSAKGIFLDGSSLPQGMIADGLETKGDVFLRNIEAAGEIRLMGARLGGDLSCSEAKLTGTKRTLSADGLEIMGGIFLNKAEAASEICLLGAKLGGDLSFTNARLSGAGIVLSADRLEAKGSVFLNNTETAGIVRLLGAKLGGNLDCTDARLTNTGMALVADRLETGGGVFLANIESSGEIRLLGAKLGGDLSCTGAKLSQKEGRALNCAGARITGAWFWRGNAQCLGAIDLIAAEIGMIADDPDCWPAEILLDRCRYGAFVGKGVSGTERIAWLSRMQPSKYDIDFWPQPYEECARALREAGHGTDAREVLIEKERLQRQARRKAISGELHAARAGRDAKGHSEGYRADNDKVVSAWCRLQIARVYDWLLGASVDYGRRPGKAAIGLACFWLIGAIFFARAAGFGEIKPNLPQIQRAPEWVACGAAPDAGAIPEAQRKLYQPRAHPGEDQLACFLRQPEAAAYPRFDPLIYSADTLLPIVSLEMQSYWIPDDRKPIGNAARLYLWLHIAAGWALTLLAVAGFSGLIKTDNTK